LRLRLTKKLAMPRAQAVLQTGQKTGSSARLAGRSSSTVILQDGQE